MNTQDAQLNLEFLINSESCKYAPCNIYTKTLFIAYLKLKFNWVLHFVSNCTNRDPAGLHRLPWTPGQENRNKASNRMAKTVCLSSLWMTRFLDPMEEAGGSGVGTASDLESQLRLVHQTLNFFLFLFV